MNELLVKDRVGLLIVWLNMWQVAVDTAISCLEAVRIA